MHTKGSLSNIEKLDYFVSWFGEMSDMEKGDFMEVIAKKFNDQVENGNGNLTFGFKKLEITDKLPSIFQVRIELFDQWFAQWTEDEKDQLLKRIKNLDSDFSENLDKVIETGKLPSNNLLTPSFEISDEMYQELRKNHQITNGNNGSLSSIDLLNTSNETNGSITNDENGHLLANGTTNGTTNGATNGHHSNYQNGHSDNSNHNLEQNDDENEEINNEDSINNQISSLETDNVQNGDTIFESIDSESNDNL